MQYVGLAGYTILLWDHIITLSDEVCPRDPSVKRVTHIATPRSNTYGRGERVSVRSNIFMRILRGSNSFQVILLFFIVGISSQSAKELLKFACRIGI